MLNLDALTSKWTGFSTFAQLIAGDHETDGTPKESSYIPSLYPSCYATREEVAEVQALADAYDAAQEARGDERRCKRGEAHYWRPGQGPGPAQGFELYPTDNGYKVALEGREIGQIFEAVGRGRVYRPSAGRQVPCDRDEAARRHVRLAAKERQQGLAL
jgi:hypothetical protein